MLLFSDTEKYFSGALRLSTCELLSLGPAEVDDICSDNSCCIQKSHKLSNVLLGNYFHSVQHPVRLRCVMSPLEQVTNDQICMVENIFLFSELGRCDTK